MSRAKVKSVDAEITQFCTLISTHVDELVMAKKALHEFHQAPVKTEKRVIATDLAREVVAD